MKLGRSFYERDAITVAKELLGKLLVHNSEEGRTSGIIVETEAYMGITDKASHSYGGRRTKRTSTLYGKPGTAYIYLIYGIHSLLNVVTGPEGVPMAVLIRALEPREGIELMKARRGIDDVKRLCKGPGSLTKAMGIGIKLNGIDMTGDILFIEDIGYGPVDIVQTTRIGVEYAEEDALKPWRFYIRGNEYVSRR
ncbi:MAG TPA: DNA-3-methyladenine glycosylase [Candidatus Korarchaeota archaeon]|nr:MAG: DNA-3-methyladenine glycosylase [Candidatus Korarchaeota archaeon]HDI74203.1 DNA-3-methyladenine glycosylase [Candidatus Korarchaeota archaeon]